MKRVASILAGFAIIQLCQAQDFLPGGCSDNTTPMKNFSSSKYLGRWYEHQMYGVFEAEGKCTYTDYNSTENGEISIYMSSINKYTGKQEDKRGSARIADDGKWKVDFGFGFVGTNNDYWVLDTDYKNYSVVYSCSSLKFILHTTTVWILTRDPHPQPYIVEHARKVMKQHKIAVFGHITTDQNDC